MRYTTITLTEAAIILMILVVVTMGIANVVFVLRHPWATTGHRLRCFPEIVTFAKVTPADCGG